MLGIHESRITTQQMHKLTTDLFVDFSKPFANAREIVQRDLPIQSRANNSSLREDAVETGGVDHLPAIHPESAKGTRA